jgi:hypothetical protein
LRVKVFPSASHKDLLTVQDAMKQVLDCFSLADDAARGVLWKLVSASTNSPLTVYAEPIAVKPGFDLAAYLDTVVPRLSDGFSALSEGRVIKEWATGPKATIVRNIFERNQNGVGRTEVEVLTGRPAAVVTEKIAFDGLRALDEEIIQETLAEPLIGSKARTEYGSVEGELLDVGTYWRRPAVQIRELKSKRSVWCQVSADRAEEISQHAAFKDVWMRHRVLVRGKLFFDEAANLTFIEALEIVLLDSEKVSVDNLTDKTFTGGLSAAEYLDKLRDGNL